MPKDPFDLMTNTVQKILCTTPCIWHGLPDIEAMVNFNVGAMDDSEDGYQRSGDVITAECQHSLMQGIESGAELTIKGNLYKVLHVQLDGNGWMIMFLDHA